MMNNVFHPVLQGISFVISDRVGLFFTRAGARRLAKEISGAATDKFLELLLYGMALAFCLIRGYRRNIRDFSGAYLFLTGDRSVAAAAVFRNGRMSVCDREIPGWNVRVVFKDAAALRAFLFSKDQDILNSILANDVDVDGNLNYLYKFGFLARDLARRFGAD